MKNYNTKWTTKEKRRLTAMVKEGFSHSQIATELGRTSKAIQIQASRQGAKKQKTEPDLFSGNKSRVVGEKRRLVRVEQKCDETPKLVQVEPQEPIAPQTTINTTNTYNIDRRDIILLGLVIALNVVLFKFL